jgi:hypothetical protein
MKFLLLVVIFSASFICTIHAQLFTGGAFNINYSNGVCVDVSPEAGYRIEKFSMGVAPFVLYKEITDADNFAFGGRIFFEYMLTDDIFAKAQAQATNIQSINSAASGAILKNPWVVSFPIGGGYKYKIADNTYAYGSILYDFFIPKNAPQKNPLLQGGVTYDF